MSLVEKNIDQISYSILKKINLEIMRQLPEPTCIEKKVLWRHKVAEVKKKLANELNPQGLSIKIEL